uniref:Putative secreted protein n=1 Tax=Ixodes ricinus TaxID=34613 RepID=A0A6B0U5D7_IXORI
MWQIFDCFKCVINRRRLAIFWVIYTTAQSGNAFKGRRVAFTTTAFIFRYYTLYSNLTRQSVSCPNHLNIDLQPMRLRD